MQDQLDAYEKATTCPFCQIKFSDVVKLIPDCGNFICGTCYDYVIESVGQSRTFKCQACDCLHVLPESGLPSCKQLVGLLQNPIEKPLSDQAKKLKLLIETDQEELIKLEAFNPRDHIEEHCVQLELEVNQTAESAVKHIHEIETDLLNQIQTYRQRCLEALTAPSPVSLTRRQHQRDALADEMKGRLASLQREMAEFKGTWDGYFKKLDVMSTDTAIDSAIQQANILQSRLKSLDQEMRSHALSGSVMQFNPNASFHSTRDHLGQLVEVSTRVNQKSYKGKSTSKTFSLKLSY